ncbi:Protein K08E4.7 [Aphelenchoides avenae]|nr:Protein K08E4.7 [Aphelenchus avenae]
MKRSNGESLTGGPGDKRSNDGTTGPPPLYQPSQKFRLELVIDNLSEQPVNAMDLFEDHEPVVDGPIVIVGSSQWSLFGEVVNENGSDYFAVYLNCRSPGAGWRLMMDYNARVVGSGVQKVKRAMKISESSDDFCVFSEKKQVLVDPAKNYVTDGAFKLEVDVTVYEPYRMLVDFFTADCNYNADAVLLVEDRPFHVNKAYLGHESDVFYQMFFGTLAQSSLGQVALEGVEADEFLQFLGAIHRMRAPITVAPV